MRRHPERRDLRSEANSPWPPSIETQRDPSQSQASFTSSLSKKFFCCRDDFVRLDAEFFQQILQRRRRTETTHPDHFAFGPHVALPPKQGSHLHRNPCGHVRRKDA